ncbi:MAG: PoNe immunity protein domain-containing protein, partial [Cyclobacteriaceae bacterium]
MRDINKTKEYFLKYSEKNKLSIERTTNMILEHEVPDSNILSVKKHIFSDSLSILIANYSAGKHISPLLDDYSMLLEVMVLGWDDREVKSDGGKPGSFINQYWFDEYNHMIWMLSLGILMKVDIAQFQVLINLIDKGNIVDYILESLLESRVERSSKPNARKVTYQPYSGLIKIFEEPDE